MERGFKGIWIPKEIWLNKELSPTEKILLAEIDSLDNGNGCYASNEYFAKFFDLTVRRIQQYLKRLTEIGYISISTDAITKQRYIKINSHFTPCEETFAEKTKEPSPIYNSINNKENINNTNVLFFIFFLFIIYIFNIIFF